MISLAGLRMFKLRTGPVEEKEAIASPLKPHQDDRRPWHILLHIGVILVMGAILFWGASSQFSNQYNDATRYQCYAIAFWQGQAELHALGLDSNAKSQCAFLNASSSNTLAQKMQQRHFPSFLVRLVDSQPTSQPFHALPPEYPLITLTIFSLPLLTPMLWYQVAFALWMLLAAIILYLLIARFRSTSAAIAFAFYLVLGAWATALGRFDLIPAGLTLGAVILAARGRWKWAYAVLALATLFKFYPAILLPVFLIAQQKQLSGSWLARKKWTGIGVFVGVCALVMLISLLLNVANTFVPFTYFFNRPIQIESFPANLLWFGKFFGYPVQYTFEYQSLDFASALAHKVSLLSTFLLLAGLIYTCWLQWRGKLDIYTTSFLALLVLLITGKVFSPQYLMWVIPFVAFVGKGNWKWLLSWGLVCALTTFIFPYMYVHYVYDQDYPVIVVRDLLILVITCVLLYRASRKQFVLA
jgi:hypothetical protein